MLIRVNDGSIELEGQFLSIFNLGDEVELYLDGQEKLRGTEIYYVYVQQSCININSKTFMNKN